MSAENKARFPDVGFEDHSRRQSAMIDQLKQALLQAVEQGAVEPQALIVIVDEFRASYPNEIDTDSVVGTALNSLIAEGDASESQVKMLTAQMVTRSLLFAPAT